MNPVYLNQSGHRWRNYINGRPERIVVLDPETGQTTVRTVRYWRAIGNWASPYVQIKGKTEQLIEWNRDPAVLNAWAVNNQKNRDLKWGRL